MTYSWVVFAFLSAVFAGLVAIFGKIGVQKVDAHTATTIRALVMFLFLLGVIYFEGKFMQIPSIIKNPRVITFIILAGIAGALSWLFYFVALQTGDATKVASIDRLSVVFVMLFSFIFLAEKINFQTILGVLLITTGGIIIALKG